MLDRVEIDGGDLYLQGAQVTGWAPTGQRPVLFLSPNSAFAPGKPIRGGIPVIFPWFGPNLKFAAAPQHGFARTAAWRLEAGDRTTARLTLAGDGNPFWPDRFRAVYEVAFGATLTLRLRVQNPASRPIAFEQALHSYFAVGDVAAVAVAGLAGCRFIDKTDGMRRKRQQAAALRLTGETDRVYLNTPARLAIDDPAWNRRISIATEGAASAIVWNPWAEKSAAMADLGPDVWRGFICVECGNVADNAVLLDAGSEHVMTVVISVGEISVG